MSYNPGTIVATTFGRSQNGAFSYTANYYIGHLTKFCKVLCLTMSYGDLSTFFQQIFCYRLPCRLSPTDHKYRFITQPSIKMLQVSNAPMLQFIRFVSIYPEKNPFNRFCDGWIKTSLWMKSVYILLGHY